MNGDDLPECWVTDLTTLISTYLSTGCPSTITFSYIDAGPANLTANVNYPVSYKISTTLPVVKFTYSKFYKYDYIYIYSLSIYFYRGSDVPHANLHSCMTSMGACVPNILATPGK